MEALFVGLAMAGALIAGYTDIKSRIVPNKITLPLIAVGIIGNSLYSLYTRDAALFLDLAKNLLSMFILGYALWFVGGWAAGDAKEFLFLAALLPRPPTFLKNAFNLVSAPYPFSLTIFLNTFLLAFPILVIYSLAISYRKLSLSSFLRPLFEIKNYVKNSFYILSAMILSILVNMPLASLVVLAFFFWMGIKEAYKYAAGFFVILMYIMLEGKFLLLTRYFVVLTISLMFFRLLWNAIQVLSGALKEEIRISDLKPGNIVGEDIYVLGDKVIRDRRGLMEKLKSIATNEEERKKFLERKLVVSSTRAAGVAEEEIAVLRKHISNGKLDDHIIIKKAMPFAEMKLLGLIASLTIGDLLGALR